QIARAPARLVPADPSWPDQARRIVNRLKIACGHKALRVDHIGSTAVSGFPDFLAKDVIDIQVTVESLDVADELAEPLLAAGYPRLEHITQDTEKTDARSTVGRYDHTDSAALWHKRVHASADPGRPTNVHLRVHGWPNQQFALLFVDWLAANPGAREDYLTVKCDADRRADGELARYVTAKEPWFLDAYQRAWEWADAVHWRP
ncbi:dephospho-CoA kinase, partial [Mycobacterium tuberculosis]